MLATRRWRDWSPLERNEKSPQQEPPKPPKPILSVLSVPTLAASEKNAESNRVPPHDPEEWRAPFVQWLDSACMRHPRAFGGVAALHLDYCEWEIAHDGAPCTRETFEQLLRELGFLMGEVEGTALVSGLAFREDLGSGGIEYVNTRIV
jgi:hypothetical protein